MRDIAPTKSNLIKLKEELQFAKLGYDLLDQKRNILVMELLNLIEKAEAQQTDMEKILSEAFKSLESSVLKMGSVQISSLASSINVKSFIEISKRKIMGVSLPVVNTNYDEKFPYYSSLEIPYTIDESISKFKEALENMGNFAQIKISIMRLAKEVKKTIRKVNALEKIAIPDLEESVKHITSRIEEAERDSFVLLKSIKDRLEAKKELI